MKILELKIENIRGIREEIYIIPNGKNIVVYGPNGTGKSGVVDAVDFLFTGNIQRLKGHGTRGMSLKDHGSHIDAKPNDAYVWAKIQVDGIKDPFEIKRSMANPNDLLVTEGIDQKILSDVLEIAGKGQHVLSRTEILKFIAAKASDRSQEIQTLLDLSKVEDLRKAFVTIDRNSSQELKAANSAFAKATTRILSTIDIDDFSETKLLEVINKNRSTLKGDPIDALDSEKLQTGIDPRTQVDKDRVYPEQLRKNVSSVSAIITEKGPAVFKSEESLRTSLKKLKDDEKLSKDLKNKRLVDMGISLLDDSGSCPLCLREWKPDELKKFLEDRSSNAKEAKKIEGKIQELSVSIDTEVSRLIGFVESLKSDCIKLKKDDLVKDLSGWHEILSRWSMALKNPFEKYETDNPTPETVGFFFKDRWDEVSKTFEKIAGELAKSDPEQKAWDTLTGIKSVLNGYLEDKQSLKAAEEYSKTAGSLKVLYEKTKDAVLERLYTNVNDDFADFYKFLHCDDEGTFQSCLKPQGAALDFTVNFHNRGMHHPRALHSEGHQDSMGLCLYLALNKKISEGIFNVVMLDDVVMSIDSGHRRRICKLLTDKFPDKQFIITTHNSTWARQLRSDGVTTQKGLVRFRGWSVDSGPRYKTEGIVWDDIKKKVEDNEISEAAAKLREHLEYFYENVSDAIHAPVNYRSDGDYCLGDYVDGSKSKIKGLIKKAKSSAKSWDKDELVTEFTEMETQVQSITARSQVEQWSINAAVHYNNWQDFDKADFLPVVEAFEDFEGMFKCNRCGGIISLGMDGITPIALKCPCGTINWNLEMKPK